MPKKPVNPIETAIQIGIIALLVLWCFYIAKPFLNPIIWAGIIAIGIYPVHLSLMKKTGLSKAWSATLLTLILLVVLIAPTYILSSAIIDNVQTLSSHLKNDSIVIQPPSKDIANLPLIGDKLYSFWVHAAQDPKAAFGLYTDQIKTMVKWLLSVTGGFSLTVLMFIFSIIIAGIFLVNAEGVRKTFVLILDRLVNNRGEELTKISRDTVKSVVTGILGIALIQSTLAGLGFVIMGIPAAGLLTFVCLVMAIVQIDILLVLIPLSIYAFSEYGTVPAIIFLIWNLVVGLSNNVLKPILLAKGVDAPMAIIFIGAIGGMLLSGIIGLFTGAVIMVLGHNLFNLWLKHEEQKTEL